MLAFINQENKYRDKLFNYKKADDRYNFIKEGVTGNPANLSAALITGKYNGGTITSAEVVDVKPASTSTTAPFLAGSDYTIKQNPDGVPERMIKFKYQKTNGKGEVEEFEGEPILLTPENDYGIQPINNILNQVGEGTKNYVSPEQIRGKYKGDSGFGESKAAPSKEQKYDDTTEAGIKAVMDKNPAATREQVIAALKKSGKIK